MEQTGLIPGSLLVIMTTMVFGLGHHFIYFAGSEDLQTRIQRLFPFLYWLLVGATLAAVCMLHYLYGSIWITVSLSVGTVMLGVILGNACVLHLRRREDERVAETGKLAYRHVEEGLDSDQRGGHPSD